MKGEAVREYSRSGWGYLVQAGFMVSEHVEVAHVEVAARWNQLRFLDGDPGFAAFVRDQGREAGAGVNVYLDGHLAKVQADWAMRLGERAAPATHLVRVALDVSF